MHVERSSICWLLYNTKLLFLEFFHSIGANLLEEHSLEILAPILFVWARNSNTPFQLASVTSNEEVFLDSKIFLKIGKKIIKVYNSHQYLTYES